MSFQETKPQQSPQFSSAEYFFRMGDHFTSSLLEVTQEYFKDHELTKEFRWTPDNQDGTITGKLAVRIGFDENERFLPRIELSTLTGSSKNWGLGRNLLTYENEGNKYIRKGGRFDGEIQVNVCALNLEECKRLADVMLLGLSYPMEYEMFRRSVSFVPDSCRIGAPTERQNTDQTRYWVIPITISAFSTWFQDFKVIAPELRDFDVRLGILIDKGSVTAVDATSLTDDERSWVNNGLMFYIVQILGEDNHVLQEKKIIGNTRNTLYIDGMWMTTPTVGTNYQIISKVN